MIQNLYLLREQVFSWMNFWNESKGLTKDTGLKNDHKIRRPFFLPIWQTLMWTALLIQTLKDCLVWSHYIQTPKLTNPNVDGPPDSTLKDCLVWSSSYLSTIPPKMHDFRLLPSTLYSIVPNTNDCSMKYLPPHSLLYQNQSFFVFQKVW